jgi:hypothetical protein
MAARPIPLLRTRAVPLEVPVVVPVGEVPVDEVPVGEIPVGEAADKHS